MCNIFLTLHIVSLPQPFNLPLKNYNNQHRGTDESKVRHSRHKSPDTSGHHKRLFNILQTEWISMRLSAGFYNIQVKGIRSCRELKVVPKKYSLLSVRWILILVNRDSHSWIAIHYPWTVSNFHTVTKLRNEVHDPL